MTPGLAQDMLSRDVRHPGWEFRIITRDTEFFLQGVFEAIDGKQTTRKWRLSRYMTKSELIQTALKCVLTSAEHQVREHFLYRQKRVYGPHFDVDKLWEIADDSLDLRKEKD